MTDKKEEILKRIHSGRIQNYQDVFRQNPSIIQSAYDAMDEYAKQIGIAFANWLNKNNYLKYSEKRGWKEMGRNGRHYSEETLYNKFLDHQNKQP